MQTWRDAPNTGDIVIAMDGDRGEVGDVDDRTAFIQWGGPFSAQEPVRYPLPLPETIRKALPWE